MSIFSHFSQKAKFEENRLRRTLSSFLATWPELEFGVKSVRRRPPPQI